MKEIEFNNIEENKFIMGYIHYRNNKNKIVYKKAIGYIVPDEDLIFCISSHNLETFEQNIEDLVYEKSEQNEKLYISQSNGTVFELKQYIYPNSNKRISMNVLIELAPLLEKYILDEDFELNDRLVDDYKKGSSNQTKKEIKKLMLSNVISTN